MALESKPLFHPEVLRQQVRAFNLPERVGDWQPKLQHWAGLIASGRAGDFKETALLPDFLTDIFCGLLGYTGPAATTDAYTLSRERHVEVDGKVADAVLGRFQKFEDADARLFTWSPFHLTEKLPSERNEITTRQENASV